jgi:hypothetical protein
MPHLDQRKRSQMPQINSNRPRLVAVSAILVLLAGLLLAACGGSSSNGSSSTSAAKTVGAAGGRFGARGAALRTCLQKNGITLPQRKKGSQRGAPGAGGPFGAGGTGAGTAPKLPNGVTRAQLQGALRKCGGGQFPKGGKGFAAGGTQRFAKFAACMRQNGVNLPKPNASGKGPIFNTKGIDTTSASFKVAYAKCVRELAPSGARPGAQGAPGADGAQPAPPATTPSQAQGSGEAGGATPGE